MKRNIIKRLKIVILNFFIILEIINIKVFASKKIDIDTGEYKVSTKGIKSASTLVNKAGVIIGTLQAIGSVTSVVILVIIGIKYMLGSAEEKAEYKETFKPYIIGCILLFSITNIVGILFKVAVSF